MIDASEALQYMAEVLNDYEAQNQILRAENARLMAHEDDTDRLDWIVRAIPGNLARSLVGDMSWTGDLDEWRTKIDIARAALG